MTETTAILYDAADARLFSARAPEADRILCLTPDSFASLPESESRPLLRSSAIYTPWRHRRALARIRRAKSGLKSAATTIEDHQAAHETLLSVFDLIAGLSARIHETLAALDGPCIIPAANGWTHPLSGGAAETALLQRMDRVRWWQTGHPAAPGALSRAFNRISAAALKRRSPVIMTNIDRGLAPLADKILAADGQAALVSFMPPAARWRNLLLSAEGARGALLGRRKVRLSPPLAGESPGLRDELETVLQTIPDPVIRHGLSVLGDELMETTLMADRMERGLAGFLPRLKPRAIVSYSFRWRLDAALGAAGGKAGIERILLSHGSHTPPGDATAAAAVDDHASGLLTSPLADRIHTQSPHADKAAARLAPRQVQRASQPVVWGFQRAARRARRAGPFRILQAGTPKAWRDHRPWMYETSDEYVDGITALIGAVSEMTCDAALTVRVREQPECGLAALAKMLPENPRVTVKTGGGFLDDLADADLLVSHSSTTIEEALAAGVPVLLWGGGCPYRHLPARGTPPAPDDRASVYAIDRAATPAAMLDAIAGAHLDRPLSPDELSDHLWPDDVGGADALATELARMKYSSGDKVPQPGDPAAISRTLT